MTDQELSHYLHVTVVSRQYVYLTVFKVEIRTPIPILF